MIYHSRLWTEIEVVYEPVQALRDSTFISVRAQPVKRNSYNAQCEQVCHFLWRCNFYARLDWHNFTQVNGPCTYDGCTLTWWRCLQSRLQTVSVWYVFIKDAYQSPAFSVRCGQSTISVNLIYCSTYDNVTIVQEADGWEETAAACSRMFIEGLEVHALHL